jgi:hypothetical protein
MLTLTAFLLRVVLSTLLARLSTLLTALLMALTAFLTGLSALLALTRLPALLTFFLHIVCHYYSSHKRHLSRPLKILSHSRVSCGKTLRGWGKIYNFDFRDQRNRSSL